jgi:hypothetical protein
VGAGRVVLRRVLGGPIAAIGAGESLRTYVMPKPAPSIIAPPPKIAMTTTAAPTHHAPKVVAPKLLLSDRFHDLLHDGQYAEAYAAAIEEADLDALIADLGPGHLLELGIAARLGGHPREAARAFNAIRTAHRKDGRAGLAALELGRLLLDELGDPEGALDALRDAIALTADKTLREDAEARHVQALERIGDVAGCRAARDLYLLHYPEGVHTKTVARRCSPP